MSKQLKYEGQNVVKKSSEGMEIPCNECVIPQGACRMWKEQNQTSCFPYIDNNEGDFIFVNQSNQ